MNTTEQLYLAMLCKLPTSHDLFKEAVSDPHTIESFGKGGVTLTKAVIFSPLQNGKCIFDYADIIDRLDDIVEVIRRNGEDISYEDIARFKWGDKDVLQRCKDAKKLDKLFSPLIWKGRPESEYISAWYESPRGDRPTDKYDFLKMRRAFAAAEARPPIREDFLVSAGISPSAMKAAIVAGDINKDQIKSKLAASGDHLRPIDLVSHLDDDGDIPLYSSSGWEGFSKIVAELSSHGEVLTVENFTCRYGARSSMLMAAEATNNLRHIFNEQVWRGRPQEMIRLYNKISSDEHRKKIDIDDLISHIIEHDLARDVDWSMIDRAAIQKPMNMKDSSGGDFHEVRVLGLDQAWKNIDLIRVSLRNRGDAIRIDDLRRTTGYFDEPCLIRAARYSHFSKVMDVLEESGERLSLYDMTRATKRGQNLVGALEKTGQIDLLLKPALWIGRSEEFGQFWQALSDDTRKKNDYQIILGQINLLTVRERFGLLALRPAA